MGKSATARTASLAGLAVTSLLAAGFTARAQGLPPVERSFPDGTVASFYGQINKGFLNYDDGEVTETYDLIDNSNSSTRFGFLYSRPLSEEWTLGSRLEFQYQPFNTGAANILDDNADFDFTLDNNLRWAEVSFDNDRYGQISLGQGSMATDTTSETDLSGTGVIAYSSVGDSAGGQIFRETDGVLSGVTVGGAFNNYDGLGRQMRIRYDTNEFSGFSFAASYGQNVLADDDTNLYDVAARYGNEVGAFLVAGALGYAWKGSDTTILSGSASGLHTPTGLNLTVAAGAQDDDAADGSFGYAKLGWIADWWEGGDSKFSVDYYSGDDVTTDGSESESYSVSFVQEIEAANTDFWFTAREYAYDDEDAEYDDGRAIFTGLRFRW